MADTKGFAGEASLAEVELAAAFGVGKGGAVAFEAMAFFLGMWTLAAFFDGEDERVGGEDEGASEG